MHTLRKARLSFGLVTIDANVATAVRDSEVGLTKIHDKCKTRLGKPFYCSTCQEVVEADHQLPAYPLSKDELVELTNDDLASVMPERSGAIDVKKFVNSVELNPMLKAKPYWLAPAEGREAGKGYAVLWNAMVETGDIGLGLTTLWGKEHPVSIEADERGLIMWMLLQQNDIVIPDFTIPTLSEIAVREAESEGRTMSEDAAIKQSGWWIEQAEMLLTGYQGALSPSDFERPFRDRLDKLIQRKLKGQTITKAKPSIPDAVPDVMEAIRASLKKAPSQPKRRRAVSSKT